MVGGCGRIGGGEHSIDGMAASITWTGDERTFSFADEGLELFGCSHDERDRDAPGRTTSRDAMVWVWGNVVGVDGEDGYRPRRASEQRSTADYCAGLYDEYGLDFVRRLNGDFVGVLYDRGESTVSVFTDRLGSWKLFFVEADDGSVVFSSRVQSLDEYPAVSLEYDEGYVVQHLAQRGPFGIKTPFEDVETYPPGTITTYDLEDDTVSEEVYWTPTFDFVDEPFEHFVDAFVERFRASVRDRTWDRSKRYGLMLSGGSDARLVLGALDDDLDVVAFHMAEWMSKEARTAERIAMAADVEFRFLRRDPDYFPRLLDRSPEMWNFDQKFNKAWAEGFIDEIRSEVDVLLTGHFCDTLFKGWQIARKRVGLGPLGTIELPTARERESLDEIRQLLSAPWPQFLDTKLDVSEMVRREVFPLNEGVAWFGLAFESLRDLDLAGLNYPASTDSFFRQSLRENLVLQMPVLDNRLVDLWLTMPNRYKIRRNVIDAATSVVAPDLAEIPHSASGVPVKYPKWVHFLGSDTMNRLRRLSPFDAVPKDHLNHGPWGNHSALVRHMDFVGEAIDENEDLIRSLPFLDWDGVREHYEDHLDGADNTSELYRLVTFLEAPITRRIADVPADESAPRSPRARAEPVE